MLPANDAADAVLYKALERGLNFKTTMGNVLTLTPPLIVTEDQMLEALEILEEAITEVETEMRNYPVMTWYSRKFHSPGRSWCVSVFP